MNIEQNIVDREDIIRVAKDINISIDEGHIKYVMTYIEHTAEQDPTGDWLLWTDALLHDCEGQKICFGSVEEIKAGQSYFLWHDGGLFFSKEKYLIAHIRSLGDKSFNSASDEFLLAESYQAGEYAIVE